MKDKLIWPIVIILSSIFAGLAALDIFHGSARGVLIFWFVLICPGMAYIRLIKPGDTLAEIMLAIGASLVISTLIAGIQLVAHFWSPGVELGVLISLSLIGAAIQLMNIYKTNRILDGNR